MLNTFSQFRPLDWLFLLNVAVIPISSYLSVRLLVLNLFIVLISRAISLKIFLARSWDILLYLVCLVVGLIYSENLKAGWSVLETSFSLLAIPLLLSRVKQADDKFIINHFYGFSTGIFVTGMILLFHAGYLYTKEFSSDLFFFYNFTEVLNSHPTYLAYYLIFVITVLYYEIEMHSGLSWVSFLFLFFCFVLLLLTGGQTAFISLFFIFSFFLLKFFLDKHRKNKLVGVILILLMVIPMFYISSLNSNYDSWDRASLWQSAISANTNFMFGVGTGDIKDVLYEYYTLHGFDQYAKDSLNTHNQFLESLLSNGILGLFFLIILMSRPLYYAYKDDDPLGVLIFFPFILYGMTEVFLGRYQGVCFFSLLHQLLMVRYIKVNDDSALKVSAQ